jgi:hypothetical protein
VAHGNLTKARLLALAVGAASAVAVKVEGCVELHREDVHDRFVGRHHDGGVGDLADELGGETSVQSRLALLLPHQEQRLPEAVVFVALFAESRAGHFVRVGDARRDGLRRSARQHKLHEVAGGSAFVGSLLSQLHLRISANLSQTSLQVFHFTHQFLLQRLVDHEVNHRLRDTEVAGSDAFVEAAQTVLLVDSFDAVADGHFRARVVVELEARLDEPDGIGGGGRDEAGAGRAGDVREG